MQTLKNQALGDGFLMYVELAEIHVPRMWVEQHPERDSQVQTRLVNLLTPQPRIDSVHVCRLQECTFVLYSIVRVHFLSSA